MDHARTKDDPSQEESDVLRRRLRVLEGELATLEALRTKLAASEAAKSAILASVLDPTISIDGRGTILSASDSMLTVFGWRPEELVGRNVNVLMPEPHHSQHDSYLENYRRTGNTNILGRTREFRVLRKDGSSIDCELSVSRADVPGASEPIFTGSFRDITERRQAEVALQESERRFRAIFDQSFQYIGLLRPDGTVVEANRAALEGVGATREQVVGQPFWDTKWWSHSPEAQERLRQAVQRAAAGEFVRFEAQHPTATGEMLSIDFSLKPVRDEQDRIVLLIPEGRDITELKRAQRSETAMLRALATIGESAAVLAHEIKNPITAVNVALRAVADRLGEDHRAVLEDLASRMQRLERIMRRTLSFTKPVELRPSVIEVELLLQQTLRQLRPLIVKTGVDVRIESQPITIVGDRQLLEEVLTNLISNALEAMEDLRGTRRIQVEAVLENGQACISVEDDGPGIPESVRATLFKPFFTTKSKGTGLGLAFCKKVIEEHHGTIDVDSGGSGGARFTVRLPAPARA